MVEISKIKVVKVHEFLAVRITTPRRNIHIMTTRKEIRSLILSFLTAIALLADMGIRALDTLPPDILRPITSESDDSKTESPATNTPAKPLTFAELATQQEIPSGNWFYGGSTTWAAIRDLTDSRINESVPDFRITYIQDPVEPPGSDYGIEMLIKGEISFAHSSRPIRDEELAAAAQRGIQLKQSPVALDAIAVVVHPDLPIN